MRGKPNTYAVNGHHRFWCISKKVDGLVQHVRVIGIYDNNINTPIGKVFVNITRKQAAAILWEYHQAGHIIKLEMTHHDHCLCAPNSKRNVPR